jgi:hypothetical protein
MIFNYQRFGTDPAGHAMAHRLIELYGKEEFASPAALKAALQQCIDENGLSLQIGQVNGIINIHGESGVILRIRPND